MKKSVKQEIQELIKKEELNCSIEEFSNKVNWYWISMSKKLSEDFIREFQDKVYWYYIFNYQDLSKEFIEEFKSFKKEWIKTSSSPDFTATNLDFESYYNSYPSPAYSMGGSTNINHYAMNYCHNDPKMIYDEYKFKKEYIAEFIKGNMQPSTLPKINMPQAVQELKAQEEDKKEDGNIAKNRFELMDL